MFLIESEPKRDRPKKIGLFFHVRGSKRSKKNNPFIKGCHHAGYSNIIAPTEARRRRRCFPVHIHQCTQKMTERGYW